MGIKKRVSDKLIEEAYFEHYKTGANSEILCRRLQITKRTFNHRCKVLNLKPLFLNPFTNHSFFNVIDSEIKAYLLGFIFGDGNVCKKQNSISVGVSKSDFYITELMQKHLNSKIKIHTTDTHSIYSVTSEILKRDLKDKGVIPNKTYEGMCIRNVPEEFYPHLIRGFFDADGCVYKSGKTRRIVEFTCSSLEFLEEIKRYFTKNNIISIITLDKKKENRIQIYRLKIFRASESEKLFNLMYCNSSYYLERKYVKFLKDI